VLLSSACAVYEQQRLESWLNFGKMKLLKNDDQATSSGVVMAQSVKPLVLLILDGWGYREDPTAWM